MNVKGEIIGVHLENDSEKSRNIGVIPPVLRGKYSKESPTNMDLAKDQPEMELYSDDDLEEDEYYDDMLQYHIHLSGLDADTFNASRRSAFRDLEAIECHDRHVFEGTFGRDQLRDYEHYVLKKQNSRINKQIKSGVYRKESPWTCRSCYTLHREKVDLCLNCKMEFIPVTVKRLKDRLEGAKMSETYLKTMIPDLAADSVMRDVKSDLKREADAFAAEQIIKTKSTDNIDLTTVMRQNAKIDDKPVKVMGDMAVEMKRSISNKVEGHNWKRTDSAFIPPELNPNLNPKLFVPNSKMPEYVPHTSDDDKQKFVPVASVEIVGETPKIPTYERFIDYKPEAGNTDILKKIYDFVVSKETPANPKILNPDVSTPKGKNFKRNQAKKARKLEKTKSKNEKELETIKNFEDKNKINPKKETDTAVHLNSQSPAKAGATTSTGKNKSRSQKNPHMSDVLKSLVEEVASLKSMVNGKKPAN